MQLTFIQLAIFSRRWKQFRLTDEDLRALEAQLQERPECGAVMAGTGGLRKMRFAPPSRHSGKSGAYRVTYTFVPSAYAIVLATIFAKTNQANLTAMEKAQYKAIIKLVVEQLG